MSLPNDRDRINALQQQVIDAAEAAGYSKASCFAVRLALEEAVVNAFKHGHADLDDSAEVTVGYTIDPDQIEVAVTDQGPGFTPDEVPDPTLAENLERPCGRGLMLIRAYMTEVHHTDQGRCVQMVYKKPETGG